MTLREIVQNAYQLSEADSKYSHLGYALNQEKELRQVTSKEIEIFSEALQKKIIDSNDNNEVDVIKKSIVEKMQKDDHLLYQLSNALKAYHTNPQVKTNKMREVLGIASNQGAAAFIKNNFERWIDAVVESKILPDYNYIYDQNIFTQFDHPDQPFYGSSKGTFFKAALLNTYLAYYKLHKISDINITANWINETPSAHATLLPESLKNDAFDFSECTYFSNNSPGVLYPEFTYIHSGYAFGGHRGEARRYPLGKIWGPEDCSSWLGKLIIGHPVTTVDIFMRYQSESVGLASKINHWIYKLRPSKQASELDGALNPVIIQDLQRDVKPGMIWCIRSSFFGGFFSKSKWVGNAGHTALVVSTPDATGTFETLGYNRDMPQKEGFGFETVNFANFPKDAVNSFFKLNKPYEKVTTQANATDVATMRI